ncbi:MAG TPA: LCP family protein [Acidimicrobiales bacterium]|nr:LCP family protein [Acidimicrobiales bacterium]
MRHSSPDLSRRRRRRPLRQWPRRLLLIVNVGVAVCLVGSGLAFGWVRYRIDAIHTVGASHLSGTGSSDVVDGLAPENILLIGNETRAGLTNPNQIKQFGSPQQLSGSLSDVIMILHLDPVKRSASILSVPRDLFVPMPAGSPVGAYNKIDAALNDGAKGPDNLIAAITDDLGIPINHYVEVNFDGFEKTVDALGGIRMDFPERLYDAYSLLGISHTGCQLLGGAQALALVRSRHLQYDPPNVPVEDRANWPYDPESDLARIVRDHIFMRVLIKTAESQGLGNPLKLNSFLSAVTDQVTMDPGLRSQLINLAVHYRRIGAGSIPETTLPVTVVGYPSGYTFDGNEEGQVDFPVQPADNRAIDAWDGQALPRAVDPRAVQVYNSVGTVNLAATTGTALTRTGLRVTTEGDVAAPSTVTETMIKYHPGQVTRALAVMKRFKGAIMLQPDGGVHRGTVAVDVGTTEAVTSPRSSQARAGGSGSATTRPGPAKAPASTASPTPGGVQASSAKDQLTPYDPRPCG